MNIYTILKPFLTKDQQLLLWGIMTITLFPINIILFNRKTLEKFDKRWDNEPKGQRFFKRNLVILYVIGTIVCVFVL